MQESWTEQEMAEDSTVMRKRKILVLFLFLQNNVEEIKRKYHCIYNF